MHRSQAPRPGIPRRALRLYRRDPQGRPRLVPAVRVCPVGVCRPGRTRRPHQRLVLDLGRDDGGRHGAPPGPRQPRAPRRPRPRRPRSRPPDPRARAVRLAGRRHSRRTRTARRGAARTRAASSRTSARSCCRTCARSQSRAQWWCWTTPGAERGGGAGAVGVGWGWERTGAELTGLWCCSLHHDDQGTLEALVAARGARLHYLPAYVRPLRCPPRCPPAAWPAGCPRRALSAAAAALQVLAEPDAHRDGVQLGAQLPPQAQQRSPLRHGLLLAARRRLPLHRRQQGQRLRRAHVHGAGCRALPGTGAVAQPRRARVSVYLKQPIPSRAALRHHPHEKEEYRCILCVFAPARVADPSSIPLSTHIFALQRELGTFGAVVSRPDASVPG